MCIHITSLPISRRQIYRGVIQHQVEHVMNSDGGCVFPARNPGIQDVDVTTKTVPGIPAKVIPAIVRAASTFK